MSHMKTCQQCGHTNLKYSPEIKECPGCGSKYTGEYSQFVETRASTDTGQKVLWGHREPTGALNINEDKYS